MTYILTKNDKLGIPTANIPPDGLLAYPDLESGVYYGVVALDPGSQSQSEDGKATILPAVLSIGFNPFYKNTVRSVVRPFFPLFLFIWLAGSPLCTGQLCMCVCMLTAQEIHIMRPLSSTEQTQFNKMPDFYSARLNLAILGYIRPEYDYVSLEALVEDIRIDCEVARRSLSRKAYLCYLQEEDGETDAAKEARAWLVTF